MDFPEVIQRDPCTLRKLRSHCANSRSSCSDWISTINSPAWVLKRINKTWPQEEVSGQDVRVALSNTAKMKQLNIFFERSDFLVREAGGKPHREKIGNGVKFAWYQHYLVYRWIPMCCVVKIFTLPGFRELCKIREVKDGKRACPVQRTSLSMDLSMI